MNADGAKRARERALLATSDPVFGALCKQALEPGIGPQVVAAVPPTELLETARRLAPDLLILDADGLDVAAFKALATKVTLVSDARIVLVSGYLAAGTAGLGTLLQSVVARFVQKPRGATSLSLADEDGPSFAAAIQGASATHDGEEFAIEEPPAPTSDGDLRVSHVDAGWDTPADGVSAPRRSDP